VAKSGAAGAPGPLRLADGIRMTLSPSKQNLFRLMMEAQALRFGSFTLKNGRVSPYFFTTGQFHTGPLLERLCEHYAERIAEKTPGVTIVFGPAYKGIPLCVVTSLALSRRLNRPIGYLFNRKEEKTHGDKGLFVGQTPGAADRLALVDDVITDGGTKREAVQLLRAAFPNPIDLLVIAFDRMEQGVAGQDAIAEFQRATRVPVSPLFNLDDLQAALSGGEGGRPALWPPEAPPLPQDLPGRLLAYRRQYGLPGGGPG
jgi:orotate phosphoribosyltransferase